jgi:dedicator of cytokinesis protein 3
MESTFAPEIDALSQSYSHPVRSPSPWRATTSPANPVSANVTSPAAQPPKPTSPTPAPRSKGHEKNRLSLTFLKRSSMINTGEPKDPRPAEAPRKDSNATTNGFSTRYSVDREATASRGRASSSLARPSSRSQSKSQSLSHSQSSEPDTSSSSKDPNRMGSVKKRLSLLNITRKSSKMKLPTEGTVAEE